MVTNETKPYSIYETVVVGFSSSVIATVVTNPPLEAQISAVNNKTFLIKNSFKGMGANFAANILSLGIGNLAFDLTKNMIKPLKAQEEINTTISVIRQVLIKCR